MVANGFAQFLNGIPWFAWIAIVAIICGSIMQIITQCQRHFERMEMIRQGLNPDRDGGKPLPSKEWENAEV